MKERCICRVNAKRYYTFLVRFVSTSIEPHECGHHVMPREFLESTHGPYSGDGEGLPGVHSALGAQPHRHILIGHSAQYGLPVVNCGEAQCIISGRYTWSSCGRAARPHIHASTSRPYLGGKHGVSPAPAVSHRTAAAVLRQTVNIRT